MDLSGDGPFAFPTVVLSASELRAVRRGSSDDDDASAVGRDAVMDSHSGFQLKVASRAEAKTFKDRVSIALKAPGVVRKTAKSAAGSSGSALQSASAEREVASSDEQLNAISLSAENNLASRCVCWLS